MTIPEGRRNPLAAAVAYDEAANQWYGEHARVNFPDGVDAWLERAAQQRETEQREPQHREAA